jgi:hypothetical protein
MNAVCVKKTGGGLVWVMLKLSGKQRQQTQQQQQQQHSPPEAQRHFTTHFREILHLTAFDEANHDGHFSADADRSRMEKDTCTCLNFV